MASSISDDPSLIVRGSPLGAAGAPGRAASSSTSRHDLNLAARFGDGLMLLHQGRVIASGPQDDVLTPANIAAAFRMVPTVLRTASGHPYLVFE